MEPGHGPVGVSGGRDEFPVSRLEFLHFAVHVGVGFRDADARDAALNGRVDSGVAFPSVVKGLPHALTEVEGNGDQYRHAGEHDERQDPVDRHQVNERQDDHDGTDEQVLRAVVGQLADLEKVAGEPCHDAPRLVVVVEAVGQLLQMCEQIAAHLGLHLHADDVPVVLDEIPQQHADQVQKENGAAGDDDGAVHLFRDVDV